MKDFEPLYPVYSFGEPNESVLLATDFAEVFDSKGKALNSGDAEVRLDFQPSPSINVHIRGAKVLHASADSGKYIELSKYSSKPKCALARLGHGDNGVYGVWRCTEPTLVTGREDSELQYVMFHLFNFVDFIGSHRATEQKGDKEIYLEYVELPANDWKVELCSLVETRERINTLAMVGGYGLSHVGKLSKLDGSLFRGTDADNILAALHYFLSFVNGFWCNPVCPVGFDLKEKNVWELWSCPFMPYTSPLSWFDRFHQEQLTELFPSFLYKWEDADWQEVVREVLFWYLTSNNLMEVDAGIILNQAAIERLSYEYAVNEKKLIERGGYKALKASDRFRLLLSSLDIPIGIPASLMEITKMARLKEHKWIDGPHALTEIRNDLVHPERKHQGKILELSYEAWKLGLWYTELTLLRIFGYEGSYYNRLNSSRDVELVPWCN